MNAWSVPSRDPLRNLHRDGERPPANRTGADDVAGSLTIIANHRLRARVNPQSTIRDRGVHGVAVTLTRSAPCPTGERSCLAAGFEARGRAAAVSPGR